MTSGRSGCRSAGVGVFSHMKYNDNAATLRLPCFKGVPPWPQSRGFVFQSSQRLTPTSLVMPVAKIYKMMQNYQFFDDGQTIVAILSWLADQYPLALRVYISDKKMPSLKGALIFWVNQSSFNIFDWPDNKSWFGGNLGYGSIGHFQLKPPSRVSTQLLPMMVLKEALRN